MTEEKVILHTEFPHVIDNTAREQFSCPQKFFRASVQKLTPKGRRVDLHFGGAFAAGLEALRKAFYEQELTETEAFASGVETATKFYGMYEEPKNHIKNYDRLILALYAYIQRYPLATDYVKPIDIGAGKKAIEFTFAVPIPGCNHPVTNDPILYAGRFDFIGSYHGTAWGVDDKTTMRLGPSWLSQWNLSSQLTGYVWAAKESGIPIAGMIMRGQSILTTGSEFAEAIEYRPQWQLNRWLAQLQRDVQRMISAWETGQFDYNLGPICNLYSGCPFKRLCLSQNPQPWINTEYENNYWNPMNKNPEEEL